MVDAEILIQLGRFFAGKFRAAVQYALFLRTGSREHIVAATDLLEEAHAAYAGIVDVATGVYRDELAFGRVLSESGHWSKNLPAMADDLHALRVERDRAQDTAGPREERRQHVLRETRPTLDHVRLAVPERFHRGSPLEVRLVGPPEAFGRITGARLHFRHVDQSKPWEAAEMRRDGPGFAVSLSEEFTSTSFPVACFAEVHLTDDAPILLPGFDPDLADQPYLVIHSSSWKEDSPRGEVR